MSNCIKLAVQSVWTRGYQIRFYPRWTHRRPLRVIEDPIEELQNTEAEIEAKKLREAQQFQEEMKIKWRFKSDSAFKPHHHENSNEERESKFKPRKPKFQPIKKPVSVDMLETVINPDGEFIYSKLKNSDPKIGSLLTTVKSRKEKQKRNLVLLEGKRLIRDALQAGCTLKYLLFSRKDEVNYLKESLPKSGATIFKMPYREMQMWSDLTTTPGIMGLFKTPDTTLYDKKGSSTLPLTIICDNIREPGNLGAILRTAAGVGCQRIFLTKGCVYLWETKVLRSATGCHFRLQIHPNVDFDHIRTVIDKESAVFVADTRFVRDPALQELPNLMNTLPVLPYDTIDYHKAKEVVLVIGGETTGVTQSSYKLAADYNGARINIPMMNNVDSLNTGVALGVISFEIRRQLKKVEEVPQTEIQNQQIT